MFFHDRRTGSLPRRTRQPEQMTARRLFLLGLLVCLQTRTVAGAIIEEPDGAAYHYTSHHSIDIPAEPMVVWSQLIRLGAWMYEFEMAAVSGIPGETGSVFRLYEGQDFLVQIIHSVPGSVLVMANLPIEFQGEQGTGVGVTTLTPVAAGTQVNLIMSRRYRWRSEGTNPFRQRRESADFQAATSARWDRFLARLSELATQ